MGNLIAVSAIFMTPAWFSHFSVLFFSTLCFSTRKRSNRSRLYSSPLLSSSSLSSSLQLQLLKLVTGFSAKHPQYIYREPRIYLYIYKFGVVGIVSVVVVVVAVFDFFRSRPAWEMFATRLQSNGKSGFSFELQKQKQRCTKSENLPASDRLADHRSFPAVWLSPPTSFYYSKVRKFEDVGINSPSSSYLPQPLTNVQKDLPICVCNWVH